MNKLSLNFFGENVSIDFPSSLTNLRNEISQKFLFSPSDTAEILVSYCKNTLKKLIQTEQDFAEFIKQKITKIDLDISPNSQLYQKNMQKLQKETINTNTKLDTTSLEGNKLEAPTGIKVIQNPKLLSSANSPLKAGKTAKNVISWEPIKGASSYKVYRGKSRFGNYEQCAETSELSFTDTILNSGSKYDSYYKIQAVNENAVSLLSKASSLETSMFGENFYIFTPDDDPDMINETAEGIFKKQHHSQFGDGRYVLAYKPGDYSKAKNIVNVGYYTQLLGLGKNPCDVSLYNVKAPAALSDNNATCNFWVGIENLTVKDIENNSDAFFDFTWSVSQAAPARRLNVERTGHFDWYYGWASGGYVADSRFHKQAGSFSQQQYYYRNCQIDGGVYGVNWNYVIHGCSGVKKSNSSDNSQKSWEDSAILAKKNGYTNWDSRGCSTVIDKTEAIREKPFLFFDQDSDSYKVFVPAMRKNSAGISWSETSMGEGTILDVNQSFYIAKADIDNADSINKQLENGKNIILAPGVFRVDKPIHITKANTIILGLGLATILPDNEETGIIAEDVGGISIAGIVLDAGKHSKTLVTLGKEGCNKDHSDNPTILHDVIFRVGGTGELGTTDSCIVINSNDVIIDHTWIWRADHGEETGWYSNKSKNGMVVNGNNVIVYGLFCEHFQEYDIIWRGENGRTYFLQNEKCYDPQKQEEWMSHDGTKKGYAAYKVTDNVKKHYAVGLGVYDVFINTNGASIYLDNAIEVPNTPDVLIENACIVEIASDTGPKVGINHIINNTAAGIRTGEGQTGGSGYAIQRLLTYCNGNSVSLNDYYKDEKGIAKVEETGENPSIDKTAEKDISKEDSSKDDEKHAWEMSDKDYKESKESVSLKNTKVTLKSKPKNYKNIPTFKPPIRTINSPKVKIVQDQKNNLLSVAEEIMTKSMGKVNELVSKQISENQKKVEEFEKKINERKIPLKPSEKERINNFKTYNNYAKEEFNRWIQYVTKHTNELTSILSQKYNECNDLISPLEEKNKNITSTLPDKKVIHKRVMCDSCKTYPIIGKRFKCTVCPNFDFCEDCEEKYGKKHGHPFVKIHSPSRAPIEIKCQIKNNK